jgi:hypothetical protein
MQKLVIAFCSVGIIAIVGARATHLSAQRGSSASATLAPTGTLRAVFLGLNPVQGRIDARTGKALDPVPDLVEALANRIHVPFAITSAVNAAGILSALNDGRADVGFLAYDPARAHDVDFGAVKRRRNARCARCPTASLPSISRSSSAKAIARSFR